LTHGGERIDSQTRNGPTGKGSLCRSSHAARAAGPQQRSRIGAKPGLLWPFRPSRPGVQARSRMTLAQWKSAGIRNCRRGSGASLAALRVVPRSKHAGGLGKRTTTAGWSSLHWRGKSKVSATPRSATMNPLAAGRGGPPAARLVRPTDGYSPGGTLAFDAYTSLRAQCRRRGAGSDSATHTSRPMGSRPDYWAQVTHAWPSPRARGR